MKVLSIKQPFAELILLGRKKIELRKWNTKFRGEFLIHSTKNFDKRAMKEFGFDKLPVGCVLGKATLVDVKKYSSDKDHTMDRNLHLASTLWGKFGFVLENPVRLSSIPAKGKLNFWDFELKGYEN